MAQNTATDDPRPDEMKWMMGNHFEDFEHEYRDDPDTDAEVVYEDEDMVIVADHSGHELNEWVTAHNVEYGELSEFFHAVARDMTDYDWSVSDPIVFDQHQD